MSIYIPLAERMRPQCLEQYIGQTHLLAQGKPLRRALEAQHLHSLLFWGPPGTGKTTLARLIAHYWEAEFITLSAVLAGVKDIRQAVAQALAQRNSNGRATVLFVDEVHRFNKAQQDAFLPHVESGLLVFIGATTENPSFELNNALLSRVRTYVLRGLQEADIKAIVQQALTDKTRGLGAERWVITEEVLTYLARMADGDARRALNYLELATDLARDDAPFSHPSDHHELSEDHWRTLTADSIKAVALHGPHRFDNKGDVFYEQISALHKSVRGTDPDAALYWLCRMLDGGCDPAYIARRLIRIASEDIGNADPRALQLALNAWEGYERLGSPEGELSLAQAVVYLACAPKSNAVYLAYKKVREEARRTGSLEVPMHLRNASTQFMREQGYGKAYRYAHDEADAYAKGEQYLPDALVGQRYYEPVERGLEIKIREKLRRLR